MGATDFNVFLKILREVLDVMSGRRFHSGIKGASIFFSMGKYVS